ncbi:acyltransferase family protein [Novosphingobium percolationis]|uniref:acyltransferase family protein n=1 Tax=Novosphingobium percolationis TaxID=2871811 RepID=UPI001CD4B48F|nr:acyltransferase [Novosphingobium percolationis]MCH7627118.1 acyltransferase [Pseudomonadota bacterium]
MAEQAARHIERPHFVLLDLARFLAAACVVLFHYEHFFWQSPDPNRLPDPAVLPFAAVLTPIYLHGGLAVQGFWALSGFVLAHAYLADPKARARFWPARIARLWPLHLITMVAAGALQAAYAARQGHDFVDPQFGWISLPRQILLMQIWWQPEYYDYNTPTWSLSVEVACYLAFWLALPALRKAPLLAPALLAGGMFLFVRADVVVSLLPIGGMVFFAGVALYGAALRAQARPRAMLAVLLAGTALAVLAIRLGLVRTVGSNGGVALAFAWLVAAELALVTPPPWLRRWFRTLGDATYGIYLWHIPIQLVLVLALGDSAAAHVLYRQPAFFAGYLVLVLGAGLASHRWIERPAQRAVLRAFAR